MDYTDFYVGLFTTMHESDKKYGIESPVPVVMEDAILHTADSPFCSDPECPCHHDTALFDEHIGGPVLEGRLSMWDAQAFFWPESAESEQ